MPNLLSTAEAAERLGLKRRQVQYLIAQGKLPAQQVGRFLAVNEADLNNFQRRPVGRPKKGTA